MLRKNLTLWQKNLTKSVKILNSNHRPAVYETAILSCILSGSSVCLVYGTEDHIIDFVTQSSTLKTSVKIDDGASPPDIVDANDTHIIARSVTSASLYIPKTTFFVILIDPSLEILTKITPDMLRAIQKHPTLLVADFIEPNQTELVGFIADKLFGTNKTFHFISETKITDAPIERLYFDSIEPSNAILQSAQKTALSKPFDGLRCARYAAAYNAEHGLIFNTSNLIVICETKQTFDLAKRISKKSPSKDFIVLLKSDVFKYDFVFPGSLDFSYKVTFFVSFLNAYDEYITLHRTVQSGVKIEVAKTLCFSKDRDAAVCKSWSRFKDAAVLQSALSAII